MGCTSIEILSPLHIQIMDILNRFGYLVRSDLCFLLGKSRTTVYDNIVGLMKIGYVIRFNLFVNTVGRPMKVFKITDEGKEVIDDLATEEYPEYSKELLARHKKFLEGRLDRLEIFESVTYGEEGLEQRLKEKQKRMITKEFIENSYATNKLTNNVNYNQEVNINDTTELEQLIEDDFVQDEEVLDVVNEEEILVDVNDMVGDDTVEEKVIKSNSGNYALDELDEEYLAVQTNLIEQVDENDVIHNEVGSNEVRTEVASKKVKKEIQDKISKATKGVCACGQLIKGKEENGVIKFPRTCNGCGNLLTKNSFKKITKI